MTDNPQSRVRSRRSFIFMPGVKPEMFPKAAASGADIVCIDLEDAIAPQHKDLARTNTVALTADLPPDHGVEVIVRINCTRTADGLADLSALVAAEVAFPAIMLPKVKSPGEVNAVDEMLDEYGLATRLHVIIETNAGLEAAYEIARASDRIEALFFGGVDMAADLRCHNDWESLLYARSRVVHAAAGADLDVVDVPYLDLDDLDGMRLEAERAAALGFSGKGSIHPKQIPILNDVFSPDADAIAYAEKVVAAFAEADSGLVVVDGKLIEKPVLRTAHRILAAAGKGA
jgi:(S)-citramalyl-CoA lyase